MTTYSNLRMLCALIYRIELLCNDILHLGHHLDRGYIQNMVQNQSLHIPWGVVILPSPHPTFKRQLLKPFQLITCAMTSFIYVRDYCDDLPQNKSTVLLLSCLEILF